MTRPGPEAEAAPQRAAEPLLRSVPVERPEPRPQPAPFKVPARDPNRFELKYWIPEDETDELVRLISPYVTLDEHSKGEAPESRSQCNTSMYLDTPGFEFYYRHIKKDVDRFKLRVRAYGEIPHGKAFFEIKRRHDKVILKSRATVPIEMVPSLLEGTYDQLPDLRPKDRRNLERFLYYQMVFGARPLVLVRAYREAYANIEEDIRVTLDRRICYQPVQGASYAFDPKGWVSLQGDDQHHCGPGAFTLLELKFPSIAPSWMLALVRRMKARRQRFSKYCAAVRHLLEQQESEAELWNLVSVRSP